MRIALLLFLLAALIVPASAGLVVYSDRPTWEAASTTLTNIDFENLIPPDAQYVSLPGGLSQSGVTFTPGSGNNLYVVSPSYYLGYDFGHGDVLSAQQSNPPILEVALPPGVTSLGFWFMGWNSGTFQFVPPSGSPVDLPGRAATDIYFFGVISDAPISSFQFIAPPGDVLNNALNIDEFAFGASASAVPEPGTLALLGAALAGLAAVARRRR
jgi:hypothetical protein